jgi:hypothetical protein
MEEARWFMWFGPPERNTLRPRREYCCIAVSYSSLPLSLGGLGPKELIWNRWLPGLFIAQGKVVTKRPRPDMWPGSG